jgi:hypothetical protein
MDAFSYAAVWDTIAQGKTIEGKSYGAAAMITDTESPPPAANPRMFVAAL